MPDDDTKQVYLTKAICVAILTTVLPIATTTGRAQGLGAAVGPFLRISPYARQVGMGEAFTAMANDINVMRYNVGGLGNLQYRMLSTHFHSWIDDTYQGAVEVAWPTVIGGKRLGVVGLNLTYFNEGKVTELNENFEPTGDEATSDDLILAFGYGMNTKLLHFNWAIGAGTKLVRQNLAGESASAVGVDVGTVVSYKEISVGATLQNFTVSKMKFLSREQSLPETFRAGVALRLVLPFLEPSGQKVDQKNRHLDRRSRLNLAMDAAKVAGDDTWRFYTGAELRLAEAFALRGGYKLHNDELSRWGAGFGIIIPIKSLANASTEIDYAFTPMEAFDSQTHRFSVSFNFGAAPEEAPQVVRIDTTGLAATKSRIQQQLELTEQARRAAEESQRRIAEMEAEMARRLEKAMRIAETTEGKIEVAPAEKNRVLMTLRINFDFDRAEIRESEKETMQKVAEILNTYPGSQLFISGHADSIGGHAYNYQLSQRRMNSVMAHLERKSQISPDRFFMPVAYGEVRPLEDNGTSHGRARNRRVEFLIYPSDAQPEIPDGSMLEGITSVDDSLVSVTFNGKVKYTQLFLRDPDRLVIDLPSVYLAGEFQSREINRGDFVRMRAAYHPERDFTRLVFDLRKPTRFDLTAQDNRLLLRPQEVALPTAVKQ